MLNVTFQIASITSDPVISADHKNKPTASFTIVTTRPYYNSNDEKRVEILDAKVQAFGKLAVMVAEKAKLCSVVYIKGRLANESPTNKNVLITAEHIEFGIGDAFAEFMAKTKK